MQALNHYDNTEYEESLKIFDNIADTSKIFFNCGVIHATIGEHERAVECYQRALKLDQYLAVAYFQQGVSNFLMGDFEEALSNFNDTLLYLRGNTYIDYEQLGLKFKLYSCEVLFNRGLCYIYLQQDKPGMQDFGFAQKEKMTLDHDVIDDAIREKAVVRESIKYCLNIANYITGLYCLLHPCWSRIQTKRGQGQESEDQRLSWQSTTDSNCQPAEHNNRLCWC